MNVNFILLLLETINVNVKRDNYVTNIIFNHFIWNFESLIQSLLMFQYTLTSVDISSEGDIILNTRSTLAA